MRPSSALSLRRKLAEELSGIRPDVVHSHGYFVGLFARCAARDAGARVVCSTVHNMPDAPMSLHPGFRGRTEVALRAPLERRSARCADAIVCVVEPVREQLRAYGIPDEKLVLIRNGIVDPTRDREFSVPTGDPPVVGSVGRFELLKGYEYFVEAAARVLEAAPEAVVRLVGEGSLRGQLESRAATLGIEDRFEFLGWVDDPLAEMAAMDVYAVSSVTDTTNLTVLEAMALGKPVVGTTVGGLPEAVLDGRTGYLVPPRAPDLLADRIAELLADPARRSEMGRAGRARFEEMFELTHMLEAHRVLYERLLSAAR
jgi:glycosyltransferase involved in cell wall biosynthesis